MINGTTCGSTVLLEFGWRLAMRRHFLRPVLSRRSLGLMGASVLLQDVKASTRFDPQTSGMVKTLSEEFDGPVGSWWQDNGGRFSPTMRYSTSNGGETHPLGQDAQFDSQNPSYAYSWEGDPNALGVQLFSKPSASVMRMSARRAAPDYPNALKEWLAPCLETSNGPLYLRTGNPAYPNGDPYAPGDRRGLEQKYGYWECRCTLMPTSGTWLWPAWWLYGAFSAEIDIFEKVGKEFPSTVHVSGSGDLKQYNLPPGFDFSQFHTYGVLWSPRWIIFYLDGIEDRRVTTSPRYDYYGPLYMQLNIAVGGTWPEHAPNNGTDAATPANPYMDIDYIRVWQFPEFIT